MRNAYRFVAVWVCDTNTHPCSLIKIIRLARHADRRYEVNQTLE